MSSLELGRRSCSLRLPVHVRFPWISRAMSYHHSEKDHAALTAANLADLFGCVDGSYGETLASWYAELNVPPRRLDLDNATFRIRHDSQVQQKMEKTTRVVSVSSLGRPASTRSGY